MALNERLYKGEHIELPTASGAKSGDPIVVGAIVGVLEIDAEAASPYMATVDVHGGVYAFSVKGVITGPANAAVAVGDALYYTTGHTPHLDKDTGGTLFGYALEAVGSGATATIKVKVKTV